MDANLIQFSHRGNYEVNLCFKSYYCVYYPKQKIEARETCKTIIWSNGTFAIPWIYHALLKHLASWGYVVVASWSPFTFLDQALLKGGIKFCNKINQEDERFKGLIDVENLGVTGHSQGGGVALFLARLANIKACVAIEQAPISCKKINTPLLILAGSLDVLAWAFMVFLICFKTAQRQTYWLKHKRAGHMMPIGNGGVMRAPICAFFEWHLHNNAQAKLCFDEPEKNFPKNAHWEFKTKNLSEN